MTGKRSAGSRLGPSFCFLWPFASDLSFVILRSALACRCHTAALSRHFGDLHTRPALHRSKIHSHEDIMYLGHEPTKGVAITYTRRGRRHRRNTKTLTKIPLANLRVHCLSLPRSLSPASDTFLSHLPTPISHNGYLNAKFSLSVRSSNRFSTLRLTISPSTTCSTQPYSSPASPAWPEATRRSRRAFSRTRRTRRTMIRMIVTK